MKQGTGNKSAPGKPQGRSSRVSLEAVGRLGAHEANIKKQPKLLHPNKTSAPTASRTAHEKGSQHK
jgi:hypothetical protein